MNKNYLYILFLLSCHFFFAQSNISYVKDVEKEFTIHTIGQANFKSYSGINDGLTGNTVYWFKIDSITDQNNIIQIVNTHINRTTLYQNEKEVFKSYSDDFTTYELAENVTAYLKVLAHKESSIPIKVYSNHTFFEKKQRQGILTGLFYGFALMVLIINVFYYFNFKDITFLYYAIFSLSIGTTLAYRDGFIYFLGFSTKFTDYTESFIHSIAGLFAIRFGLKYLRVEKKQFPYLVTSFYTAFFISLTLDFIYTFTGNFNYFFISDVFTYYIFFGCWLLSVLLYKKYIFASYIFFAYVIVLLLSFNFFIASPYGLEIIKINPYYLRIGMYIEMLVITYGEVHRSRVIREENIAMNTSIRHYLEKIESLSSELDKNKKGEENFFTKYDLSLRENEILDLLSKGMSNKEISYELSISINTVKHHVKNIYQKLNINSRKEVFSLKAS